MEKGRTHLRQHRENIEVGKKQDPKYQLSSSWAMPCGEVTV